MRGQTVILRGDAQRALAKKLIDGAPQDAVVYIGGAKDNRSDAQNRMIHKWFRDIEQQVEGESFYDIKAYCNLTYGRPILARDDPEWDAVFGFLFDVLTMEKKLKAVRKLDVPFTRRMSVDQLSEYMDQMMRDYIEMGIRLTDPELQGRMDQGVVA